MKIYYAHSMQIYNTEREKNEMEYLKRHYERVINPNGEIEWNGTMRPYLDTVKESDLVVASEYRGHVGKGVYTEIKVAKKYDVPVKILRKGKFNTWSLHDIKDVRVVDPEDWSVNYGEILL